MRAMKSYDRSRGIAPLVLNLDTGWIGWSASCLRYTLNGRLGRMQSRFGRNVVTEMRIYPLQIRTHDPDVRAEFTPQSHTDRRENK
jgi:hypothetical protein